MSSKWPTAKITCSGAKTKTACLLLPLAVFKFLYLEN